MEGMSGVDRKVSHKLQHIMRTVLYLAYLPLGEDHLIRPRPLDNRINFSDNYVMIRNNHHFLDSIFSFKQLRNKRAEFCFPRRYSSSVNISHLN